MTEVLVFQKDTNIFEITIKDKISQSKHIVTLKEPLYQSLTKGTISKEECLKASFRFLLEREPKEAILNQFDISVISHYFPEYRDEIKNYF